MANFEIFRVERLKTMGNVRASGLHNFREIEVKNAISEHFEQNEFTEIKSAEMLFQAVSTRIGEIDKKDKQACRCLEFFVSASPEQFAETGKLHDLDSQKRYFDDALNFIKKKHGAENVVCHSVHRDEKTPHMVVYAVPVVHREAHTRKRSVGVKGGGRTLKEESVAACTELSAKAFYNCPAALSLLQDEFHAGVGKASGLERGISRTEALKNKKSAIWYAEEQARLDALRADLTRREKELATEWEVLKYEQDCLAGGEKALARKQTTLADDQAAVIQQAAGLNELGKQLKEKTAELGKLQKLAGTDIEAAYADLQVKRAAAVAVKTGQPVVGRPVKRGR